jgi:hypothetical protein
MSRTMSDRAALLAAFDAAELRTATTGKLSAPCVHIEPGDPWSVPARLPGRGRRGRRSALAGQGAYATLGDLIDGIDSALRTVPGCELPAWAKPSDYAIDGVPYAATVATIQLATT